MQKLILNFSLIIFSNVFLYAQNIDNVLNLKPSKKFENILVEKLSSDSNSTTFVIWVKKSVPLHKHVFHSESLYILEGDAEMTIGEETVKITKGDFFQIPENTVHSVVVNSETPLKVLSIQAPEFLGKDRVFVD